MCAIAVVRGSFPAGKAIATFMASPLMLPGSVLGIAFLQAARGAGLRDAYTTLLIAHVVITMPFVMRTVLASLAHFDFAMVDAARTLGYSFPRALGQVLVPNILPGFLSGHCSLSSRRSTIIRSRSSSSTCGPRRCRSKSSNTLKRAQIHGSQRSRPV